MRNTFAPDSVADSTIFGVCTSVNPRRSMVSRKPATLAAAISNPAFSTGCRSVVGAWSRMVGRLAVTDGRYRSNGGGAAGPGSGAVHGPGGSAPPGARWVAGTGPAAPLTGFSGRPRAGLPAGARAGGAARARPRGDPTVQNVTAFRPRP